MRSLKLLSTTWPSVVLAALALTPSLGSVAVAAEQGEVELEASWQGKVQQEGLHRHAPKAGFVAGQRGFETLWKAWRPDEPVPAVDFNKFIVLVGTVPGPNQVAMRPRLDEEGNLTFTVAGTKIGGPGFGYAMQQVSRKGVKSVNVKPLKTKNGSERKEKD